MMKAMKMLKLVDTTVLNFRKLGVIVFICWTLLRFKECLVKTIMDESIQVSIQSETARFLWHKISQPTHAVNCEFRFGNATWC